MHIAETNSYVYPDAVVIFKEPEYWEDREDIITNPLLIVEVLSPSTEVYDKLGEFELYQTIPSFQEYVLVNTDKPKVEVRFQEENGLWRFLHYTDMAGLVPFRSLGISIPMSDIFEHIKF